LSTIAGVFFDLDDTLLDHRGAERAALSETCRVFTDLLESHTDGEIHDLYHRGNVRLWHEYAAGNIKKEHLKEERFRLLLDGAGLDVRRAAEVSAHYLDCYSKHWTVPAVTRQTFLAIADHYPVGIITNGFSEIQRAKMARFPEIHSRLAALVISEEVGIMKPDPGIFRHAERQIGIRPDHLLYVGDSLHSDVEGALAAGWQAAWYTTASENAIADAFTFSEWEDFATRILNQPARQS
jgi:5'-nucleotidase